jgi:hypothetical protein
LQNVSDSIILGEGYLILPDSSNIKTLMMDGKVHQGDFIQYLKKTNKSNLNLIANPFPSALRFNFSDFEPKNCYSPMIIDVFGNFTPIQSSDTLHLGEGFFVLAKTSNASLKFKENLKIGTRGTSALGKGKQFSNSTNPSDLLIELIRPDGSKDQTKINFSNKKVTHNFDSIHDVLKLENIFGKANIAVVKNQNNLALNLIPQTVSNIAEFPIRVWKNTSSSIANYSLNIKNIEVLKKNNYCINLEDKLLGITFNLEHDTVLSFQKTENDTSIRFTLNVLQPIELSIENALCFGDSNGSATANLKGYYVNYLWKNQLNDTVLYNQGGFSNKVENLTAGKYNLQINQHSKCGSVNIPFEITQPDSNVTAKISANKTRLNITKNDSIIFTNLSKGALNYVWDFGNGDSAFTKNASHYFKYVGNYLVKMVASMETCEKSASIQIEAFDPTSISEASQDFRVNVFKQNSGVVKISADLI